ncbi:hypothetical protein BDZ94DRAFT_1176526 [Collybia nuda]|uniref:Uncharacterized protein n=1 Tax=Collybia nuda TaxID=64659 RepID=A0A9P5XSL9_9AGAR|nr:hypothetical protein BDZ94DRAFT_1176526 [Collybia nuda]
MIPWLSFLFAQSLLSPFTQSLAINYTVDDSAPDPRTGNSILYSPDTEWNTATLCQGGSGPTKCLAQPDKTVVSDGTWHDSTFFPGMDNVPITATFRFEGTAIYVYCVLVGEFFLGDTDMTFVLDGQAIGHFTEEAPSGADYEYNVLAFSDSSLPPGSHELKILNGANGEKSFMILDRIVYS